MKKGAVNLTRGVDMVAKAALKKAQSMKGERRPNENYYFKASRIFDPKNASHWCSSQTEKRELARNNNVYTSSGINAIRRNTDYLMSHGVPKSGVWWKAKATDKKMAKDDSVTAWFDEVSDLIREEQEQSLYYALRKAFAQMFISYGMIYQGVRRDRGKSKRSVFYEHVPSHAVWYRKNIYGEIFQGCWERSINVDAYYEAYGEWPEDFKTEEERATKGSRSITVMILVERNTKFKDSPKAAEDHEYIERHIDVKKKQVIDTRGYHHMPFHELEMGGDSNGEYPVGVAYDALPDALSANVGRKTQAQALAFAGRPVQLTNMMDAVSKYGKQMKPGAFIEGGLDGEGKPAIAPLDGLFRPEVFQYSVAEDEMRVRDTFRTNELVQQHANDITATASYIIAEERSMMASAFVDNVMPALVRICENHILIWERFDQLPEAPFEDLADTKINIVSPTAMQAKAHELVSMREAVDAVMQLAQLKPEVVHGIDPEAALCRIADATGTEGVISVEKFMGAVKEMQEQAKAQQVVQMEQASAETADKQAGALEKVAGAMGG